MVRNPEFTNNVNDYYISEQRNEYTNYRYELWIHIYLEENNVKWMKSYLEKQIEKEDIEIINRIPKEDIKDKEAVPIVVTGHYSLDVNDDPDFRKFLHDNTLICFDLLYETDILSIKKMALFSFFISEPIGQISPEKFLDQHFNDNSQHYKTIISENRGDKFWESFSRWSHFYHNLIIGVDLDIKYDVPFLDIKRWSNILNLTILDHEILDILGHYSI